MKKWLKSTNFIWLVYVLLLQAAAHLPESISESILAGFRGYFDQISTWGAIANSLLHMRNAKFALLYHGLVVLLIPLVAWNLVRELAVFDAEKKTAPSVGTGAARILFGALLFVGMGWYLIKSQSMHFFLVSWGADEVSRFALLAHIGTGTAFALAIGLLIRGFFNLKGRK